MAFNATKLFRKNALLQARSGAQALERSIATTSVCNKVTIGRYRRLEGRDQLLTYDQATKPYELGHMKSWNTWNTSTLAGGKRSQLTAVEDAFIRRFLYGSWFCSIVGEQIIIKRQHNMIRIAFCISKSINTQSAYFMTGFCEELLSIWLHCAVKLEVQAVERYEGYVKVV